MNGGVYQGSLAVSIDNGRAVIMEDPAAALNMTDRRWNAQVQKVVRDGEAKEAAKIEAMKAKNAAIWEVQ